MLIKKYIYHKCKENNIYNFTLKLKMGKKLEKNSIK